MQIQTYYGFIATLLFALPAHATAPDFSSQITETTLSAVISSSAVQFNAGAALSNMSNTISADSFKGATGVIAISQNSGANANVQQAVSVSTGAIVLSQ